MGHIMTEEEWKQHRQRAVTVPGLGEVSRMDNGLIAIEGRTCRPFEQLTELEKRLLANVNIGV